MLNDNRGAKTCCIITSIFISLMLSVFILICSQYTHIAEIKYYAFLLLCGSYIVAITVTMCVYRKEPFPIDRKLTFIVLAYLVCTAISVITSPYEYDCWTGLSRHEGIITQTIYCFLLIYVSAFGQIKKTHLYLLGATITVFSVICIIQFFGGNPLHLYPDGYDYYDKGVKYPGEFLGTVGNAGFVSTLLAMSSAVFFSKLLTDKQTRTIWFILFLLSTGVLFFAKVAAGILGLAASVMITLPIVFKNKRKQIIIAEILMITALLMTLYFYDIGSGTVHEFHEVLHGRISENFGSGRIKIWREVLSKIPEHLFFGTGPDTMLAWDIEGFSKQVNNITVYRHIDVAHNEYLNVLAQQGLFAALCCFALIGYACQRFIRIKNKEKMIIPVSAIVAYGTQAVFGITSCIITPIFIMFFAVLHKGEEKYGFKRKPRRSDMVA